MFRLITALLLAIMLLSAEAVAQGDGELPLPELEVITAENIAGLELLKTIGRGSVLGLIYTPDGQNLIVSTGRGLWVFKADALDSEPTHIPYEYGGELALVSDTTFALLDWDEVSLWDVQKLEKLFSLEGQNPSFNPRDNTISTRVGNETLLWSPTSGELTERFDTSNVEPPYARPEGSQMIHVTDEAYSMNGRWAAYAGWGGADLFDTDTGEGVALVGSCCDPGQSAVVFSPDSQLLAVGDLNGYVDFWRLEPLQLLGSVRHADEIDDAMFSPNGDRLAVSSIDNVIRIWDTATFKEVDRLEGFGGNPSVIAFTPDNTRIVTANLGGTAWRWDLASGEMLSTAQGYHFYVSYGTIPYPKTIDITDNAALLATGSTIDGIIRLWTPRGESRGLFEMGLGQDVRATTFSPNGQLIAGAGFDFINIWNLTSGDLVNRLSLEGQRHLIALEFAPSNSTIAMGFANGDIILHDLESEVTVRTFQQSSGDVAVLEFSNDSAILASAPNCWSCTPEEREDHIFLWDMVGGEQIAVLEGHEAFVSSLNFNLDATLLLSTSQDGTIRFWNVADKSPALTIQHFARSARFSLDGKLLIVGDGDGSVGVWGVPAEH